MIDIDDEVVETSDIEELAEELDQKAKNAIKAFNVSENYELLEQKSDHPPRKRAKYFHEHDRLPSQDFSRLSISPTKSVTPTSPRFRSSSTLLELASPSLMSILSRSSSQAPTDGFQIVTKDDFYAKEDQEEPSLFELSSSLEYSLHHPPHSHSSTQASISTSPIRSPLMPITVAGNQATLNDGGLSDSQGVFDYLSTTPISTPPHSLRLMFSRPSLESPRYAPSRISGSPSYSPINGPESIHTDDEFSFFTPERRTSRSNSPLNMDILSPLSLTPAEAVSGDSTKLLASHLRKLPYSSPSPTSPKSPYQPTVDDDHQVAVALEAESHVSRYPLRKRNVAQLNPYTVENLMYKRALKSNPQAIVKFKNLERHRHHGPDDHYEEDGETQQDAFIIDGADDEDEDWKAQERRRQRREEKKRQTVQDTTLASTIQDSTGYRINLPDLSDSEDEGRHLLAKEAKKAAKEMERKQKLRDMEERQHQREDRARHARRYPLSKQKRTSSQSANSGDGRSLSAINSDDRQTSDRDPSLVPQSPTDAMIRDYFVGGGDSDSEVYRSPNSRNVGANGPPSQVPSSLPDPPHAQEQPRNDGMEMHDENDWHPEYHDTLSLVDLDFPEDVSDNVGANSLPMDVGIGSDIDEGPAGIPGSGSNHGSDIEFELDPRQERWAKRVLPKSMLKKLAKTDTFSMAREKNKKRSSRLVERDDEGPLRPGQSRIQKSANPKDIRAIKGDSDSEIELDSNADDSSQMQRQTAQAIFGDDGDSESDVVEILESYRKPLPLVKKGYQVIESVEENYDSEDTFDDEDIQTHFLPRQDGEANHLRETSLIDFMLTRSRNIGGPRKARIPSRPSHHQPSRGTNTSGYKLDITTRGARGHGHTKQSLLSFHVDAAGSKAQSRRSKPATSIATAGPSRVRTSAGTSTTYAHAFTNSENDDQFDDLYESQMDNSYRSKKQKYHRHKVETVSNKTGPSSSRFSRKSSNQRTRPIDQGVDYLFDDPEATNNDRAPQKMTWKEQEKARRKRARMNGVWCNPSAGQVITTGVPRVYVTIAVEDEAFNLALAPESATQVQRDHWSNSFRPLPPEPRLVRKSRAEHVDQIDNMVERTQKTSRNISSDMGIPLFQVGKTFGISTYIGKGWLYELVNVITAAQEPVQPSSINLLNFCLEPDMGVDQFCSTLPNMIDSLFEFATGLPDPDHEMLEAQWSILTHCASRLVSWYTKHATEAETNTLRESVEKEVFRLIGQIENFTFKFIDTPVLLLCWFAVEISTRSTPPSAPITMSRPVKATVSLLLNFLLRFKFQNTMKPLDNGGLDGTSTEHYTAELWACLIHLFNDATSKQKNNIFWSFLLEALQTHASRDALVTPFDASENAWFTIFSLCTLSQISVHGMVAGQSRLPACWDAVVFALKQIRLTDTGPHDQNREQRDKYVAMTVIRCLHLHEKWGWKLDNASAMFNALAEIFRSRKFANLLHEIHNCDLPEFMRVANWDHIAAYNPKDTTYTVFLKLVVQAAREDPLHTPEKPSPKIKKLLSIAVPLGSLPPLTSKDDSDQYLSMLYNRLCAVAIAIDLDVNSYDERMSKAQGYVTFADAGHTVRWNLIRSVSRWAVLLVNHGVRLDGMKDWFESFAKHLCAAGHSSSDYIITSDPIKQKQRADLMFYANTLLAVVRQIVDAHVEVGRYPEPLLIVALKPLLTSWIIKTDEVKFEFGRLARTIFKARSTFLPPPARPPLLASRAEEGDQDSQDFGIMDDFAHFDFGDLEALADPSKEKEDALRHALEYTRFKWIVVPFLTPCLLPPPAHVPRRLHEGECDTWIRLWLCCGSVESQADKWTVCLRLLDTMLGKTTDEYWKRRVQLSVMFQLLKIDPMAYLTLTDRAVQVFLFALVSDGVILEKEYVAFLLSIAGLQHPLIQGATCLPARDETSGDYIFSSKEFSELRLALLKVVFHNINCLVRKEQGGSVDVLFDKSKYTQLLVDMLSSMRGTLPYIQDAGKLAEYTTFCREVIKAFRENPELSLDTRFDFWIDWGQSLVVHQ